MDIFWWTCGDSNPRPSQCECDALPTELQAHKRILFHVEHMECQFWCPRRELNPHRILRTDPLYPLSYRGMEAVSVVKFIRANLS